MEHFKNIKDLTRCKHGLVGPKLPNLAIFAAPARQIIRITMPISSSKS
jgi:hypothetical protein